MFDIKALENECNLKAIRSSGSGGQHVNKVATKIELSFSVIDSLVLNENQKSIILDKLSNRLTKDQVLLLQCGETRSQLKNKGIVLKRLVQILKEALKPRKIRKSTKVPKAVIKRRLKSKKINAQRKENRRKPELD